MKKALSTFLCFLFAISMFTGITYLASAGNAVSVSFSDGSLSFHGLPANQSISSVKINGTSVPSNRISGSSVIVDNEVQDGKNTAEIIMQGDTSSASPYTASFHYWDSVSLELTQQDHRVVAVVSGDSMSALNGATVQLIADGNKVEKATISGGKAYFSSSSVNAGESCVADIVKTPANVAVKDTVSNSLLLAAQTVTPNISLSYDRSGLVIVKITDSQGNPLKTQFHLTVGTTEFQPTTNADGKYSLGCPSESTYVYAEVKPHTEGLLTIHGAHAVMNEGNKTQQTGQNSTAVTTTAKSGSTTTTEKRTIVTSVLPSSGTTYATYVDDGTTSISGKYVVLGVAHDSEVLTDFGLLSSDVMKNGRFLLTQDAYSTMMGNSKGILRMFIQHSDTDLSDAVVEHSVENSKQFKNVKAENINRLGLKLSLLLTSDGKSVEYTNLADSKYIVHLPVPTRMQDDKNFAVAQVTADGMSAPVQAKLVDGHIEFETTNLSEVVLLSSGSAAKSGGSIFWLPIVLIIIGVLLIGGTVVLLYFVVIRKPKAPVSDEDDMDGTDSFNDDGNVDPEVDDAQNENSDEQADTQTEDQSTQPASHNADDFLDEPTQKSVYVAPDNNMNDLYSDSSMTQSKKKQVIEDVSLGLDRPQEKPQKKNPKDYDIDL